MQLAALNAERNTDNARAAAAAVPRLPGEAATAAELREANSNRFVVFAPDSV